MGHFFNPPQPFVGGRQPSAPKLGLTVGLPVDNPPPTQGGPRVALIELAAIAQPDPWTYAFLGGRQPYERLKLFADQLSVVVSSQVYVAPGSLSALMQIVTTWQPDPWLYAGMGSQTAYKARQVAPGVPGQSVDRPPVVLGGPFALKAEAVQLTQPDPWTYTFMGGIQLFDKRKLTAPSVDAPPIVFGGPYALKAEGVQIAQPDPWTYSFMGRSQPFDPRRIPAGVPGQSIDAPPTARPGHLAQVDLINRMQPDPWVYAFMGHLQPFGARTISPGVPGQGLSDPPRISVQSATSAQQAAFSSPAWNGATWTYLFMGRQQPYAPSVSPPGVAAVSVDAPPFGNRSRTASMQAVMRSWDPPPYDFQVRMYASGQYPLRRRPTARGYIIL